MNFSTLPELVIHSVFEYLPPQDLVRAGATCKRWYKFSKSETLPQRLLIPKLDPRTIQKNALMLCKYPEGNFNVDNKGGIFRLKWYHLFAKFFKWIYHDHVTQKLHKAVETTFQEIYRLNLQGYLDKKHPSSPPRRLYVWNPDWFYASYFPADYLAKTILQSKQFVNNKKIEKAAKLVEEQADLYQKNCYHYDNGSIGIVTEDPQGHGTKPYKDERVFWHDERIKEAFFSKEDFSSIFWF